MDLVIQTITFLYKGGPVMYLLLACSFFVVAIGVERFLYYRNMAAGTQVFQQKLQTFLEKQRFSEAVQFCEQTTPNALTGVALSTLRAYQQGSQVESALESAAALTAARLRAHLDDLSMVVTLSPLLGLLGTVIGMINSFSIFNVQSSQPLAITGGIGEALVATATGLCVAVTALVLHGYFSRRANRLITDIEQIAALVISYITLKKTVARRETHEIA